MKGPMFYNPVLDLNRGNFDNDLDKNIQAKMNDESFIF